MGVIEKIGGMHYLAEKGHAWKESGYDTGKEGGGSKHSFAK